MARWHGLIAASSLWAALSGCAHVAVDSDGTRRIVGFMVLTLPPAHEEVGADAVRIRSLGLTVTRGHAAGAQLTLGYSDTTIAAMRNDSVVSRATLRRVTRANPPPDEE